MKKLAVLGVAVLMVLFAMTPANAVVAQSPISYGDGLYASGDNWANPATTLSWNVTQLASGYFQYDYTFTLSTAAGTKGISHVIIEVSENFTAANVKTGTTAGWELGMFGTNNGNPGIPDTLYGLKWDGGGAKPSLSWTIVTDRAPMLGDFYAKDGNDPGQLPVFAYSGTSSGFGGNVAVPDSVVPIPGAAYLFGSGIVALIGLKRRRPKA